MFLFALCALPGFVPDAAHCSATPACAGLSGLCCPTSSGKMLECCADMVTAHIPAFELPETLNATNWCAYANPVSIVLDSLTLSAAESVLSNVTSGEYMAGGAVNVAVGAALLLAPILLGPSWPTYLVFVLSAMLGAIVSNKLLKSPGWLTGQDRSECATGLVAVTVISAGLGFVSLSAVNSAFFTMGAAAAGLGAHHAAGLIVPMLSEHDIELEERYVYIFVSARHESLRPQSSQGPTKNAVCSPSLGC